MKVNKRIKTIIIALALTLICAAIIGLTVSCGNKTINGITVVSREEGSGTRDAFDSIVELDELSPKAITQNSTGNVMTKVGDARNAIGYISLGSLNETVKALSINGVAPTAENILSYKYKLYRNFNIVTKKGVTMSPLAQDFIKFIHSADAEAIITQEKFIAITSGAPNYVKPAETMNGTLKISGSTSVDPLMQKLKSAYIAIHQGVSIEIEGGGSSVGIKNVTEASDANAPFTIGMASRELKSSETSVSAIAIAIDGVAVIVNPENDLINDITVENLKAVFEGKIESFNDIN